MVTPLGVEAFTATVGSLRLLDDKPRPLTDKQVLASTAVVERIPRDMRTWLSNERLKPQGDEPAQLDYFDTLKALSSAASDIHAQSPSPGALAKRQRLIGQLSNHDVGAAYLSQADRCISFLSQLMPRAQWATLAGPVPCLPGNIELSRFWRAYEIAGDPLVVFRDLDEGILVSDQVHVLTQLWPELYREITKAILLAISDLKGRDDKWDVPFVKERQVETILQISRVSPDFQAKLQAMASGAGQPSQSPKGAGPKTTPLGDKTAESTATDSQRISAK